MEIEVLAHQPWDDCRQCVEHMNNFPQTTVDYLTEKAKDMGITRRAVTVDYMAAYHGTHG